MEMYYVKFDGNYRFSVDCIDNVGVILSGTFTFFFNDSSISCNDMRYVTVYPYFYPPK